MKAMILAAGAGMRLRPLTYRIPKPLIRVGPDSLIERHLRQLAKAGFTQVVINVRYRKKMIIDALGDGTCYGVEIVYSDEGDEVFDTGGGVRKALPLLGDDVFLLINADIHTDWQPRVLNLPADRQAHLLLVKNPPHNPNGDFALDRGTVTLAEKSRLTYAGIGYYRPALFAAMTESRFKLVQPLKAAVARAEVSGEICNSFWMDAGTPDSLAALRRAVGKKRDC